MGSIQKRFGNIKIEYHKNIFAGDSKAKAGFKAFLALFKKPEETSKMASAHSTDARKSRTTTPMQTPKETRQRVLAGTEYFAGKFAQAGDITGAIGELGASLLEKLKTSATLEKLYSALGEMLNTGKNSAIQDLDEEANMHLMSVSKRLGSRNVLEVANAIREELNEVRRECDERTKQINEYLDRMEKEGKCDDLERVCLYLIKKFPSQLQYFGGEMRLNRLLGKNILNQAEIRMRELADCEQKRRDYLTQLIVGQLLNGGYMLFNLAHMAADEGNAKELSEISDGIIKFAWLMDDEKIANKIVAKIGANDLVTLKKMVEEIRNAQRNIVAILRVYGEGESAKSTEFEDMKKLAGIGHRIIAVALNVQALC